MLSCPAPHFSLYVYLSKHLHLGALLTGAAMQNKGSEGSALLKIKKGMVLHGCNRETRLLTKATNPTCTQRSW